MNRPSNNLNTVLEEHDHPSAQGDEDEMSYMYGKILIAIQWTGVGKSHLIEMAPSL